MDYFRIKQEKGGNLLITTRKVYLFSESAWNLLLPYSFYKSLGIHSCVPNINNVYDVFCFIIIVDDFETIMHQMALSV